MGHQVFSQETLGLNIGLLVEDSPWVPQAEQKYQAVSAVELTLSPGKWFLGLQAPKQEG